MLMTKDEEEDPSCLVDNRASAREEVLAAAIVESVARHPVGVRGVRRRSARRLVLEDRLGHVLGLPDVLAGLLHLRQLILNTTINRCL